MAGRGHGPAHPAMTQVVLVVRRGHRHPSGASRRTQTACEFLDQDTKSMSQTIVMKFGGTSVADADRIKSAARRIVAQRDSGKRVVAVLSARGKTTDEPILMAAE